ncbi:hypothetical protein F4604DRAFT_1921123 [Suillus subluteus]|nr:hypothetical protein F4604DRAFT_1921123 [Suillus subluteus]
MEQPAKRLCDGLKVQEVPKASAETNDADGTARGPVEAPASTKPAAAAAHANSEPNDTDGTARGSVEAPASTEPAAAAGHADIVPARSLPPLSPLQICQQVPLLPENYTQTNAATLVMRPVNDTVQIELATHVEASNTLRTDPVHADPTTRAVSQDNNMHADPIRSDRPPSLQPDLANHRRSEPPMEAPHDPEVRPVYDPCPRGPLVPRYGPGFTRYPQSNYYHDPHAMHRAPQLPHGPQPRPHQHQPTHGPPRQPPHGPQPQYHNGGYHDAPYHDSRDGYDGYVDSYWHPPSSAYFGLGGRYQHGYGREYPNEYPEDPEDGG